MPFFSWFKSKPEQPEASSDQPAEDKTVSTTTPPERPKRGPRRSKLRDTIPEEELIVSVLGGPSHSFSRPQRATADVPLANILAGLPAELRAENQLSLAKRVQMPRRDLSISADGNTASATVAALYAACPDIFSTPIDPGDTQLVSFSLTEPIPEIPTSTTQTELIKTESDQVVTKKDQPSFPEPVEPIAEPVSTNDLTAQEEKRPAPEEVLQGGTHGLLASDAPTPTQISVPLPVLWPQFETHLSGPGADASTVSAFQIPFDQIQSQLATGKVTVPAHLLVEQLPTEIRAQLKSLDPLHPVALPLREIIPQLPPRVVQPRADQEPEVASPIITPFSRVAQQDALRLRPDGGEELMAEDELQLELGGDFQLAPRTPLPETPEEPTIHSPQPPSDQVEPAEPEPAILSIEPDVERPVEPKNVAAEAHNSDLAAEIADGASAPPPSRAAAAYSVSGDLSAVSDILLWEQEYDLPGVVEQLGRLPGLESTIVYSPAGKVLAGTLGDQIPEHVVTSLLPPLFAAARQRLRDVDSTELETLTFAWQRQQISLFWQENLCLAVRHSNRPFKPGVREKLVSVLKELAAHVVVSEA